VNLVPLVDKAFAVGHWLLVIGYHYCPVIS
jgi:hypothetical protein